MFKVVKDDGVAVVTVDDIRFSVVIPPRKRINVVVNNPLLPVANVFVHEDEYDTYAAALKNVPHGALLTHNVYGLCAIRNYMLDQAFKSDHLFQYHTDDDFEYLLYIGARLTRNITDVTELLSIITQSAITASEIPCGLFGYSHSPMPQEASPLSPFDLRGRINVDFGILDHDLRFDTNLRVLTDADYFLQSVAKWKCAWKDMRFYTWSPGNAILEGGLSHIRTTAATEAAMEYMRQKWGDEVVSPPKDRGTNSGVTLKIPR